MCAVDVIYRFVADTREFLVDCGLKFSVYFELAMRINI